ncbi:M16 family metallopeptidase [Nonomuraea sediminis]|uniref:M16 family metallopeptidase n=1 Tax=Nonomuraea sediminis TaxID=2835864 RepID=UPI001BDC87BC|nr:insulinase family protein [Nonomuraea sediminis]
MTWSLPPIRRTPCTLVCPRPAGGLAAVRLVGEAAGREVDAVSLEEVGAVVRRSAELLAFEVPAENLGEALRRLAPPAVPGPQLFPRQAARDRLLARLRVERAAGTLVIVGAESPADSIAEALGLAEPARPPAPARLVSAGTPVTVPWPGAVQPHVAIGYGVPGRADLTTWAALTVACHMLGGGLSALLNRVLRDRHAQTYGFTATLESRSGVGTLLLEGAVRDAEAVDLALAELRELTTTGLNETACAEAVSALLDGAWARYESAAALADELASLAAEALPPEHLQHHLDALRALDARTVSRALALHLSHPTVVTVSQTHLGEDRTWAAPPGRA